MALHFDYDSMVGSNEVFKDRETGSKWQQTLSTAMSGPLKGTHLEIYPFLLTQWGEWRKQHPDTLVLKPLPEYAERMPGMNKFINQQWSLGISDKRPAPSGAIGHDTRLGPREIILGLQVNDGEKAYPLSALRKERVINDTSRGHAASRRASAGLRHHNRFRFDAQRQGSQIPGGGRRSGSARRSRNALHLERIRPLHLGEAERLAIEAAHYGT